MKSLLSLVIFLSFYHCFCYEENITDSHKRYVKCVSNTSINDVNLYWFTPGFIFQHKFLSINTDVIKPYSVRIMVSTCICLEQPLKPIFFISPYYENGILEDVYVYCIPGKPESFGIYDEYEIYDKLLIEHTLQIPNSLMIPLLDEKIEDGACLDKYGNPTKALANQKSCMLAITIDAENELQLYSGPLTLSAFNESDYNSDYHIFQMCYTSLKNTTHKLVDSCIYVRHISTFLCCCAEKPQKCSFNYTSEVENFNGNYLFCASNEIMKIRNNHDSDEKSKTSIKKYYERHVKSACGIKISIISKLFQIDYYAADKCKNETIVNSTKFGYCASENETLINVQIFKCCTNGHFCNMNLANVGIYDVNSNICHYKPTVLLALDDQNVCEIYYDLNEKKRVYLFQHFNVKIIYETTFAFCTHENFTCSYVYGRVLKADAPECREKHLYNKDDSKTFLRHTCTTTKCDKFPPELLLQQFECQHFKDKSSTDIIEIKNDSWICYVQINDYYEKPQINAGHLNFNDTKFKSKIKECHDNGIYDSNFCCVNIVNINQTDSNCTVEKQRVRFEETKAAIENPSESGNSNNNHGKHLHCYSKDIQDSESEHCPLSDGCFSTRTLKTSETSSDTAIEPAGCLGYAEDYTVKDVPLASLSLGCRVGENSNRCSVVQSPDGQQRVVCCCNQNDENGLCNTNLNKVPEKIGKSIASFKSLA